MIGFSFYLQDPSASERIEEAGKLGVKRAFTSLHIPEEQGDLAAVAAGLLEKAAEAGIQVFADISANTHARFGLSTVKGLNGLGVSGLRLDDGFSPGETAALSEEFSIAINASILFEDELLQLLELGVKPQSMIAWHNYYPRRETGLDEEFFSQQNKLFSRYGIRSAAFVPGRGEKRGPLYEGLPTLEKHRSTNPLHAAAELKELGADFIFIGDPDWGGGLLEDLILYEQDTLRIPVHSSREFDGCYKVRPDLSRDVIRLMDTRSNDPVPPQAATLRRRGAVTVDNDRYGRYKGEMQIVKNDLPTDERVNVIGMIDEKDLPLLSFIRPGTNVLLTNKNERLGDGEI
ncbi:DUF871 family protein [Bacillus mangrovi]|uniref:DUF871 family protein n=1 Tax=Metabacillus mangrovi TaxID=1491830 RepID=A0A7X2V2X2_9BACI|nr:MupG family TIM beta-alpha barrel fold protein [Metabacillus mangrovi]MTH51915.1 DUF871 family protein [Metabacillus mangrovi]